MDLKTAIRNYYIVNFLKYLASSIPTGIMFLFILERGFDLQDIGLIFGVLALTIILFEVPTGGLADAIGRKKTAIYSYLLNATAILLLYLSTNIGVALAYAVAAGLGRTLGSGSLDAWFIDEIKKDNPDEDLQPYLARADVYETLANTIGALLGGISPLVVRYFWGDSIEILAVPLLFSLIIRGFSLYSLVRLIPNDTPDLNAHLEPLKSVGIILQDAISTVAQNRVLQRLLIANFANGLALGSFDAFWQPHFKTTFNLAASSTFTYGLLQSAGYLFATFGGLLATWFVVRSKSHSFAAIATQILKALSFVMLALATNLAVASLAFGLFYIALMMNLSPHGALYNHNLPSSRRSSLMSIGGLIMYLGAGVGAYFIGWLADQYGFRTAFLTVAVVVFLSAFVYLGMKLSQKPKDAPSS